MQQRLVILAVLYATELTMCKDTETEANTHVNSDFIKDINEGFDVELEYFRATLDKEDPVVEQIKDQALHDLFREHLPEIGASGNAELTHIYKYEMRVQQKGVDSIQAIASHLEKKLNLSHVDLTPIVKNKTSAYISKLKKYFSDIEKERPNCHLDKEYIIIDMVNIVSLIRRQIEKTLLDRILAMKEDVSLDEIEILEGTLVTFNDNDKEQEMEFMCANLRVCRPIPPFSDYLFKFLDGVATLNNDKFHYFLIKSSQMLNNKQSFIETVLRDKIVLWLKSEFNNMMTANITQMRDIVLFLRSVVIRRYRINYTNDKKIETKAKSLSIIIDIMDIAFGIDGNDLYGTQMDKMILTLNQWAAEMRNDIEETLFSTIQYIFEAMNYNLTPRAREEIMALADIIFYNKSGKQKGTEYLMTQGSKFVKGLIHRPEPKKPW